jgi:hypothetical protein
MARLSFSRPFWALFAVAEGLARADDGVEPGLELARDAKIVHRRADHDQVGALQLLDHAIGQSAELALCGGREFGPA